MRKLQNGFTLIELMIDVAISGVLSAATVPHFISGQTPMVVDSTIPSFIGGAAGDIDSDDTIDHWTISDQSRTLTASGGGGGGHGHSHGHGGPPSNSGGVPCSTDQDNPSGEPANDT